MPSLSISAAVDADTLVAAGTPDGGAGAIRIGLARCWLKSPLKETVVLAVSVILPALGVAVRLPLANPLILLFVDVGCCCICSWCPTTAVAGADAVAVAVAGAGAEAEMLSNSVIAS